MKSQSAQVAYDRIVAYIKEKGGAYPQWYCGIAADWEDRLFNGHKIPNRAYEWWIVPPKCFSNAAAREAEDALHKIGCDGAPGGGDEATVYVYAYLKGSMTKP